MENTNITDQDKLSQAKKRAKDKVDFISHFLIFVVINAILIVINLLTSPNSLWFVFPFFGWGIGLVVHFFGVFVFDGFLQNLEKKFVEQEMRK